MSADDSQVIAPKSQSTASSVDFTQEIRFAVVMYGGSSLAIYMNGVAQELLRMVRATAPDPQDGRKALVSDEELRNDTERFNTERVYRKLGRMLSRAKAPELERKDDESAAIRTRFVIDILSGTSAGGINSVFLAKALANDQEIETLKKLWIKQGDASVLINDAQSDKDIKLGVQDPPRSLFNSPRMYYELLDALEDMDKGQASGNQKKKSDKQEKKSDKIISPYADEIDLFTTATDIRGMEINIPLADTIAHERRHLNTFHFRFVSESVDDEGRNEFTRRFNPFLAFAARVTSAHPAPFEPMKLADIDPVLDKHADYRNKAEGRSDDKCWRSFYEEYLERPQNDDDDAVASSSPNTAADRDRLAKQFLMRPFSDGGVLDNSPFSFAIDKLQFRHTEFPVDRKLIYIEPVPEHPAKERIPDRPPDALENAWLSLSALPRYQFIRDDLMRLLDRNNLVGRVNRILKGILDDEAERLRREGRKPVLTTREFGIATLGKMIEVMGSAWGGYQRLRVGETTDELVKLIAGALGFDERSGEYLAIHYLVAAWRDNEFDPYGTKEPPLLSGEKMFRSERQSDKEQPQKFSQNWFLFLYDLKWRLRRLKFVLNKIDDIACADVDAEKILGLGNTPEEITALFNQVNQSSELREELRRIKRRLSDVLKELRLVERLLISTLSAPHQSREEAQKACGQPPVTPHPFAAAIQKIKEKMAVLKTKISADDLRAILQKPANQERVDMGKQLFDAKKSEFHEFLDALNELLQTAFDRASRTVRGTKDDVNGQEERQTKGILEIEDNPPASSTLDYFAYLLRRTLLYFYENFDRYDMISYPILYATDVGDEMDVVEVFRISPEDAKVLVPDQDLRRRKLAGTLLGDFGAFFDEGFRINDILWGRLDCADRMITALLSSAASQSDPQELERVRVELIQEASRLIIADELGGADKASLRALLVGAMNREPPGETPAKAFDRLDKWLQSSSQTDAEHQQNLTQMRKFLRDCLSGRDTLDDFVATNNFDHKLPPQTMVKAAARASRVFGKMLEGIADLHRVSNKRVAWITRLAQIFWALVEVAIPDSVPNLIFRHWLKLLYFFEVLLVFGGTLLLNPTIQRFGFIAFAATAVIHTLVLYLSDKMTMPETPKPRKLSPMAATKKLRREANIQIGEESARELTARFEIYEKPTAEDAKSQKRFWRAAEVIKAAVIIFALVLIVFGLIYFAAILGADSLWPFIQKTAQPYRITQSAPVIAEPNNFRIIVRGVMLALVVVVFLGTISKEKKKLGVRLVGTLALLLGLGISGMTLKNFQELKSSGLTLSAGFHQPVIAIELAGSAGDVAEAEQIFAKLNTGGDSDKARAELKQSVDVDFGFIAGYTLINLSLCYWLSRRNAFNALWGKILGIVAALCSLGAAIADVLENLQLYKIFNNQTSQTVLDNLRRATLFKWGLTFAAVALFSLIFLRRKSWLTMVGIIFLLIAVVGFIGVFAVHPFIELAFISMGIGMTFAGGMMLCGTESFIAGLR